MIGREDRLLNIRPTSFRMLWRRHLVYLFVLAVIVIFGIIVHTVFALVVYCNTCYCYRVLNCGYVKWTP